MKYNSVIFDMDGVLIDNSEGIMTCAKFTIERLGLTVPPEKVLKKFIGPALTDSLQRYCGASEEQALQGAKYYRQKYFDEGVGIKLYRFYDGVTDTVKRLYESGVTLFVASGKPQECAEQIVRESCLSGYITAVSGTVFPATDSSKNQIVKKVLTHTPALMVGDRVFDIESAKYNGIDCAFALYGFGDESDYADLKPQYFIDKPQDLIKIVL